MTTALGSMLVIALMITSMSLMAAVKAQLV